MQGFFGFSPHLAASIMTDIAKKQRVELYDTTLRDGTQGLGIALTVVDKINIARLLDDLGFDYIEGATRCPTPRMSRSLRRPANSSGNTPRSAPLA